MHDFSRGDAYREITARCRVFQADHVMSVTDAGFKNAACCECEKVHEPAFCNHVFFRSLVFTARTSLFVAALLRGHNVTFHVKSFVLVTRGQGERFRSFLYIDEVRATRYEVHRDMHFVRESLSAANQTFDRSFRLLGKPGDWPICHQRCMRPFP